MKQLRAFLFAKGQNGTWSSSAFRELEPLFEAARHALASGSAAAAIHVGFWRPETEKVAKLAQDWENLVLLSESAAGALPPPTSASASPVGDVDGLHFHVALFGFGYEMADPSDTWGGMKKMEPPRRKLDGDQTPIGWVAQLIVAKPDIESRLQNAGIWDEESFHQMEGSLDLAQRLTLALDRYETLTGSKPTPETILDNLHACPQWLLDGKLIHLPLSVRTGNVCRAHSLQVIGDLALKGASGLLKMPNMGRGSTHGLAVLLCDAFIRGDMLNFKPWRDAGGDDDGGRKVEESGDAGSAPRELTPASSPKVSIKRYAAPPPVILTPLNLVDGFVDAAQILKGNQREIWEARLGFRRDSQTLQQLGDQVGRTRERVRQIEKNAFKKVRNHPVWDCLSKRLAASLHGRTSPLMLAGLYAIDPWFKGAESMESPLREVFTNLLEKKFSVLNIDGVTVISQLSVSEWGDTIEIGKTLMRDLIREKTAEEYARFRVEALLGDRGAELREDLWRHVSANALWAQLPGGEKRLSGYGRTAEAIVTAVLEEAGTPLHFKEIFKRASALTLSPHDVHRLHNAAQSVAFLYGRGRYGLLSHCPLSKDELAVVEAEVEDLVSEGEPTRQWHASEFFEEMLERGMDFDGRLTKHIVNIALLNTGSFVYMGRMVWGLKDVWIESAASRLDVRQAVISLLEASGKPLTKDEILSQIEAGRGVGSHFQIHPTGNLIRIGPTRWGLADRDVKLQNPDALIEIISRRIDESQEGIHISEAKALLPEIEEDDAQTLWSIAKSMGMQVDRGQYLFPASWPASRRMSPAEAVRHTLRALPSGGATLEALCEAVNCLTKRQVPRQIVRHMLASSDDVDFDETTGRWTMGSEKFEADEDMEPEKQQ